MNNLSIGHGRAIASKEEKAQFRAEAELLQKRIAEQPQVEVELHNHFAKDVYGREIRIKKGTLLVGKIHKFQNMNIIAAGDLTFFSVDGAFRVKAPQVFVASPGAKRVIYAHEDSVWINVHGTAETDLKIIEETFIAKDYAGVEGIDEEELKLIEEARKCLGLL